MTDNSRIGQLPPLVRDPAMLSKIVRKRVRRAGSRPIGWPFLPEQSTPDIPDSMEALSEEIDAARPILDDIHYDIDIFAIRDRALDEVLRLMMKMRDRVLASEHEDEEIVALRADIEAMIAEIDRITSSASHHAIPLLRPFSRAAVLSEGSPGTDRVEIVFIVPRAERLKRDISRLARHAREISVELVNRGLTPRFGLMSYGRGGDLSSMRNSYEDFERDLMKMEFRPEPENTLQAIRDSLWKFIFRDNARKIFVVFSDADSDDDVGGMREETIALLQEEGVTVFALSANDPITRRPLDVYDEIARATGGKFHSIDAVPYETLFGDLTGDIVAAALKGIPTDQADERDIPLGPQPGETLKIRLPDLRPSAFGLDSLPLDTADDFAAALARIDRVLFFTSTDRAEKNMLNGFLYRVLDHFHNTRANWLNFWV